MTTVRNKIGGREFARRVRTEVGIIDEPDVQLALEQLRTDVTALGGGSIVTTDNAVARFNGIDGTVQDSGILISDTNVLSPATSDMAALGSATLMWSDLFLASGAVINFDNGDVTVTHAANTLTFGGASSGYAFTGGPVVPATSDAAALGTTALMWSDLFLASGAVINFNNGDVLLTHSANTLALTGASSGYSFDAAVLPSADDAAALGAAATSWADLFLASGAVVNFANGDVTVTHATNTLTFGGASSGYAFTGGPVVPATSDAAALGTTALMWSDLFLASGAVVNFDNGDVTVTHAANTLTFGGASSGYAFTGGPVVPATNDAAALGTTALMWSDLFLASGAVVNWNNGDLTLTHSSNLLTLAGGDLSLGTSAVLTTGTVEVGAASDTTLSRSAAGILAVEGTPLLKAGKQTIWLPASAMLSATTSGPASAQFETGTNDINFRVLDFDATADEHAHFNVAFPKSWDEGTVTFQVWWTTTATDTDGVAWGLQGIALSDNEASDTAFGTAIVVTDDAQSAAGEILVTAESAAVTVGGTPAEGDVVFFRIFRDVSDANDDMTEDARLIGVKLFFTTNAATDV